MRVAIVSYPKTNKERLSHLCKALAEGISTNGHQVDIIDGVLESEKKLTFYDYIVIGTEPINLFGGKLPERLKEYLAQCGNLVGKRSFAFLPTGGLRSGKSLRVLMTLMEHEGMFIKNSDIIKNEEQARELGKRLHIS